MPVYTLPFQTLVRLQFPMNFAVYIFIYYYLACVMYYSSQQQNVWRVETSEINQGYTVLLAKLFFLERVAFWWLKWELQLNTWTTTFTRCSEVTNNTTEFELWCVLSVSQGQFFSPTTQTMLSHQCTSQDWMRDWRWLPLYLW